MNREFICDALINEPFSEKTSEDWLCYFAIALFLSPALSELSVILKWKSIKFAFTVGSIAWKKKLLVLGQFSLDFADAIFILGQKYSFRRKYWAKEPL